VLYANVCLCKYLHVHSHVRMYLHVHWTDAFSRQSSTTIGSDYSPHSHNTQKQTPTISHARGPIERAEEDVHQEGTPHVHACQYKLKARHTHTHTITHTHRTRSRTSTHTHTHAHTNPPTHL